jgi:hypothetical protein
VEVGTKERKFEREGRQVAKERHIVSKGDGGRQ